MKKVMWVVVAAAWACWMAMVEPRIQSLSGRPQDQKENKLNLIKLRFSTKNVTPSWYLRFMYELNQALTQRADRSYDFPVQPSASELGDDRYLHLVLTDDEAVDVTLAIDISNLYVVGYLAAGNTAYFFSDTPQDQRQVIFPDADTRVGLSFSSRYGSLEGTIRNYNPDFTTRRQIPLGIRDLHNHITSVYNTRPNDARGRAIVARGLIVFIQMFSEASRFTYIQQQILATISADGVLEHHQQYYPTGFTEEVETSWSAFSTAVQSAIDGVFTEALTLTYDGIQRVFRTVREVQPLLALMLFCNKQRQNLGLQLISDDFVPARSLMEKLSDEEEICDLSPSTATSYITGFDGLCVDVKDGSYDDGNPIILWECGNQQINQLWTFSRDEQTIRSNGKCLSTADGMTEGSRVVIYDCNSVSPDAINWQVWNNGTIYHPASGLALNAKKSTGMGSTFLTLSSNRYGATQGWYVTNNTQPRPTLLVTYDSSWCLVGFQFQPCQCNNEAQLWALYPDGTIRAHQHRDICLFSDGFDVGLAQCNQDNSDNLRWLFKTDGTILHMGTQLVLDVKDINTSMPQLTINSEDVLARPTQIWFQEICYPPTFQLV